MIVAHISSGLTSIRLVIMLTISLAPLLSTACTPVEGVERPNVVFIFSDQQHYQAMGFVDSFYDTPTWMLENGDDFYSYAVTEMQSTGPIMGQGS